MSNIQRACVFAYLYVGVSFSMFTYLYDLARDKDPEPIFAYLFIGLIWPILSVVINIKVGFGL